MKKLLKKLPEKLVVKAISEYIFYGFIPLSAILKNQIQVLQSVEPWIIGCILAIVTIIVVSFVKMAGYFFRTWMKRRRNLNELATIKEGSGIFYYNQNNTEQEVTKNKEFLLEQFSKATILDIIGATGYNTFTRKDGTGEAVLRTAFEKVQGEIRILLVNPDFDHTSPENIQTRPKSLGMSWDDYKNEILKSIQFLKTLKDQGKNIALKFYCQQPVWKIIRADDFMWLQHYKNAKHVENMPVYGIEREQSYNNETLFEPLHSVFEKKWYNDKNPEYDFTSDEIIYDGKRIKM